jgi:hypothetical protein
MLKKFIILNLIIKQGIILNTSFDRTSNPHFFFAALLLMGINILLISPRANAVPSFARQTGQSCSACHTQSFGPNLTPFGREFKLGGYTMGGGKGIDAKVPALSAMIEGSLTNTQKDQAPGTLASGYNQNNNFTFDQASLFYAGRIYGKVGAFSQLTYDGYTDRLALDNTDIRFADQLDTDIPVTYGISLNNNPTVQDLWNTTSAWSFPYTGSAVQPSIGASSLIDGAFSTQVGGGTAYTMINNLLYLEAGGYASLNYNVQKGLGVADAGQQQIDGAAPYWRAALQKDYKGHYVSLGHYGMIADVFPGRDRSNGTDHYSDLAVDATYQYMGNPKHIFEAKTTYIYEDQKLNATRLAGGLASDGSTYLTTYKFNTSYTYDQTYGLTFAYNRVTGSQDANLYSPDAGYYLARPNSQYYTAELVYVPFGKSDAYHYLMNLRTSLQYIGYSQFNGSNTDAQNNNTFMVNGWLAF